MRSKTRIVRHLVWQVLLLGFRLACVGQQSKPGIEGDPTFDPAVKVLVAHTSWTVKDGAPSNITALAQTSDEYLWLGTPLGLYRFDGIQFVSYPTSPLESPLQSAYVESMASDSKGGLWVAFHSGGISHLAANGRVTEYKPRNRLGPGPVDKIIEREDGSVWAIGNSKVLRLTGSGWEDFGALHGLPSDQIFTLFFDSRGNIWTSERKKLFVLRKGESRFVLYPEKTFIVVDMAETSDGELWISDGWRSVRPLVPNERHVPILTHNYVRIQAEPNGTLWLAQDYRGVSYVPVNVTAATQEPENVSEITSEQTNAILRDREGNIWIGTSRGLDRLRMSPIETLSGIRLEYYPALASDPVGGVWIGDLSHPLLHIQGSHVEVVGPRVGSSPMVSDQNGEVWLVDPITSTLTHYAHGQIERDALPDEARAGAAQSISFDRFGNLLVSFDGSGLWRYDGQWKRVADPTLPKENPLTLARDPLGRVWIGYANSVVFMQDERGFHLMSGKGLDGVGDVLTFAFAEQHVWAAGAEGLSFYRDGAFHRILLKHGGALRGVSGVVADQSGDLWLNASAGVIRIESGELRKSVETGEPVQAVFLNDRQGLVGTATQMKPAPSAALDKDGRVWFSTSGAVFAITPRKLLIQHSSPAVQVESVIVDGKVQRDREHTVDDLTISSKFKDLEIDYIGIDLTAPEQVSYRYMLDGEDGDWRDVGSRPQATYDHLAPGTYTFRVQAKSEPGQWTEMAVPVVFHILPAIYQRWWFYALETLAVIGLLYLVYVWRVHLVTGRVRWKLKERSEERVRIARELHDTLLQSVQGLMLRFHFATEALPADEPVRDSLRTALSRADDVLLEGRRRVHGLREEMPEGANLRDQVERLAEEMELQPSLSFKVSEVGVRRSLVPVVQLEVCRIAKEALTNAVRHADAKQVEVTLTYGQRVFLLDCHDTGKGIPPHILRDGSKEGHWGLIGMRERATGILGKLDLKSSSTLGTRVSVSIPARIAYSTDRGGVHWIGLVLRLLKRTSEPG